jgi:hypothetical protein
MAWSPKRRTRRLKNTDTGYELTIYKITLVKKE